MNIKISQKEWVQIKIADEMEERFCEICKKLMGTMSKKAWEAGGKVCDECGAKLDKEQDIESGSTKQIKTAEDKLMEALDKNTVTRDDMRKYLEIQFGGRYNMITDGNIVMRLMGVSREKYLNILEHYDEYLSRWPELEQEVNK